jgi:hypothetical protein
LRSLLLLVVAAAASADDEERGEAHAGVRIYAQPASGDTLVVITPSATAHVRAARWLTLDAGWSADVVTGATPRTYGPPDVVTAATRFSEFRNLLSATANFITGPATISGGYTWGNESDYRSHTLRLALLLDLFNHNTQLSGGYSHSFDSVCDLAQAGVPLLLRQPLDRSLGCFSGISALTEEPLNIDTAEASLTQTLTPKWLLSLIGTYQHLDGFQSNPYRTVRLSGGLFQAQESHPDLRHRGSLTLRLRYAVAKLSASLGADVRLYRDSWGVQSITAEINWEQPFQKDKPDWRFGARARGYLQSGAVFYRDAGNADSYDRAGPAGMFFTADQALAPLADLLIGVNASYSATRPEDRRYARMFTELGAALLFDYVKIFALTPQPPNAARIDAWASALVVGLSGTGKF